MFVLLGICLALIGLLTINAFASSLAVLLWRALQPRAQRWTARARAQTLFALRIFPGAVAIVCVAALLLPAYIAHEPRQNADEFSFKLGALAAISAAGLLLAAWRGVAAWVATRRLVNNWLRNAEPIKLNQAPVSAYRLRHPFPVVAVVGAFRPRLFVADQLFDQLSQAELAAVIAHECGHLAARDNLKQALLRACRDALTIAPCGRGLDRAWAQNSEAAADEYAARSDGEGAINLASALVKIARLAPAGVKLAIPAGALLIGEGASGIAQRVSKLTQLATTGYQPEKMTSFALRTIFWLSGGALLTAAWLTTTDPHSLVAVHNLIEVVVSALQ
ncbi:MAG: M56 family metallopeptidase [Blastocatellia bacterium]